MTRRESERASLCRKAYERAREALDRNDVEEATSEITDMFGYLALSLSIPKQGDRAIWETLDDYYANFRDEYVEAAREVAFKVAKAKPFLPCMNFLVLADMPIGMVVDEFRKGWKELGKDEKADIVKALRDCNGNEKILFQNAFMDKIPYVLAFALGDNELMERLGLWKKD